MRHFSQRILPIIGILCVFAMVLLNGFHVLPGALGVEPSVTVEVVTPSVPLGGAVFLRVNAPGAKSVSVVDGEKVIPARQRDDGRWEALHAVWMEEKPGERQLTVQADMDGFAMTATASYTITKRAFPVQHLRMSKSQDAIYDSPEVEEEYRLIREAIHQNAEARDWQGAFALPTKGRISTRYGTQRYRNGKKVGIHKGIDIAAPAGTLVHAANDGVVVLRGDFLLHGRTIVVDHGGGVTGLYIHLRDFGVSEGQRVKAGQKIARVGSTGVSTGPHLHYALYVNGTAVDPVLWQKVPAGW
ncbi:MAG: M23 family metallopeptidase [Armatimonadota bacterium]